MLVGRSLLMAPWIEEAQEMRAGQKQFEKEVSAVLQLTQILLEKARTKCGSGGAGAAVNWSKVLENLRKCEHKLKVLKRHRMQSAHRMKTLVQRSFSRLRFMRKMTPPQAHDLLVVDHLVRRGLTSAAQVIAKERHLEDVVESEVFRRVVDVAKGIQAGELDKAIDWCVQRRSALRKLDCSLEFQLKHLVFMTKIQNGQVVEAVHFARKYLAPFQKQHLGTIKSAMAMLAFSKAQVAQSVVHTSSSEASATVERRSPESSLKRKRPGLQEESSMEDLEIPELRKELARAFLRHSSAVLGLSEKTDLEIYVLAGLAALKSRRCSTWRPDKSSSLTTVLPGQRCPCCHPIFAELARNLPYARRSQSQLICRISGEVMNENNPPMALPNGQVFSLKAVRAITGEQSSLTCPVTGKVYRAEYTRKVYVL